MTSVHEERATAGKAAKVEFDHHSSKMTWAPADVWHRLQHECPVAWTEANGGYFVLTNFDDLRACLSDTQTFTTVEGTTIPQNPLPPLLPEDTDGPFHRHTRSIINPFLAPQRIKEREPWMRQVANDVLDRLEGDTFDGIRDFAGPFPRFVSLDLMNMPLEDEPSLSRWTDAFVSTSEPQAMVEAAIEFLTYMYAYIARRRNEPPAEDLSSVIMHSTLNGEALTDDQCLGFMINLLLGGLHTTTGALSAAILWLADHPEDRRRLIERPELMSTAVDEFLRIGSPVPGVGRYVLQDTEVRGCPIPAGSWAFLAIGAANIDPAYFDRPDEVILDRNPNHHMALGMGPHRCAGSHLAKVEIEIAITELLRRFPNFRVADHGKLTWVGGGTRGLGTLPLEILR